MTTLTIESPVRQRLPNDISSLKTWAAPILPSHIDTFSPKVGVPANDDEVESPVRQRLPNDISSLKTWTAPILPSHINTFSPKVSVPANDDEVVVHNIDQVQNANWFSTTARALLELLYLPDGWDSYGAKQVKPRAVEKMLETLMSILEPNTPTPAVVPTSQGGVQVEWHRSQVDFEIEVTSSGELSFFFKSPTEEQEGSVKEDQTVLKKYIRTIKAT